MESIGKVAVTFLLLVGFEVINGGSPSWGPNCLSTYNRPTFNMTLYLGRWYDMKQIFYDPIIPDDVFSVFYPQCATHDVLPGSNGNYRFMDGFYYSIWTAPRTLSGTLTVDPTDPTVILFTFDKDIPVPWNHGTAQILSTDYTTYAVVYICREYDNGKNPSQFLWILTREPSISSSQVASIVSTLKEQNIEVSEKELQTSKHYADCPYAPIPTSI